MTGERLLNEALEAWAYTRRGVVAEIEVLAAGEWDFRPEPGARSFAELARHIVESGAMMAGELPREDGDFRRQGFDDFVREYAGDVEALQGRDELLQRLAGSQREGAERIRAARAGHMLGSIHQFDGTVATRLSWMHHGIAHEMCTTGASLP